MDEIAGAFNEAAGPNVKETELLKAVLGDACQTLETKQDFAMNLLKNDETLGVGVFGDEYVELVKNGQLEAVPIEEAVKKLSESHFANVLHTNDPIEIEAIVTKKFEGRIALTHIEVIDRAKSLILLQASNEKKAHLFENQNKNMLSEANVNNPLV